MLTLILAAPASPGESVVSIIQTHIVFVAVNIVSTGYRHKLQPRPAVRRASVHTLILLNQLKQPLLTYPIEGCQSHVFFSYSTVTIKWGNFGVHGHNH